MDVQEQWCVHITLGLQVAHIQNAIKKICQQTKVFMKQLKNGEVNYDKQRKIITIKRPLCKIVLWS